MRRGPTLLALLALGMATTLGCSGGPGACPESFEAARAARGVEASCEVLRDPDALFEASKAAYAEGNLEKAYDYLALLHSLHPESERDREAYKSAAALFARVNFRYRPERNRWDVEEPRFMFAWLEQFFEDGAEFPQEQVNALFLGLRWPLFTDFLAYTKDRPAFARWQISARKDNGIIQSVAGERSDAPTS
jgi:hypothetical protein